MTRWAFVLLVAVACTQQPDESRVPQCVGCIGARDSGSSLQLCGICVSDGDCESGICKEYGDGYRKCSRTCVAWEPAPECAAPATGGCNGMGHCMCPRYEPRQDAGAGDAPPLDAPTAH